jgi:cruciform cutting endonuclease 1
VLVERIATELQLQHGVAGCPNSTSSKSKSKSKPVGLSPAITNDVAHSKQQLPWSILSIDMGVRNLAFAHLRVSRSSGSASASPDPDHPPELELTAWHKLAVSEISNLNLIPTPLDDPSIPSETTLPVTKAKSKEKEKEKENYIPSLYAQNAYKLITSLLEAYKPTHILIERQRFRSGGGSAVQEWTLRVGVFEGMLYAIIHALREERGGSLQDVVVQGIEPKRVVRYWLEGGTVKDTNEKGDDGKAKRLTARDVKKAKIDLVAGWISSGMKHQYQDQDPPRTGGPRIGITEPGLLADTKIVLASPSKSPVLHDVASGYLRKWQGQATRKSKAAKTRPSDKEIVTESPSAAPVIDGVAATPATTNIDIGKLDDLADCLLQGVTWVEWQVMRERIVREGVKALESMPE